MTRYTQKFTMAPVPEPFASIYRRRGMQIPELHSGHDPAALVPYGYLEWHRAYARAIGYFWLPCPLCDEPFGGHEIGDTIPDPTRGPECGLKICPACTAERNGGQV